MKTILIIAVAALAVGSALALHVTSAQQPGTKRTDLQRHVLSAPGREVIQVRVDFDPGYVAPMRTHWERNYLLLPQSSGAQNLPPSEMKSLYGSITRSALISLSNFSSAMFSPSKHSPRQSQN